MPNAPIIWVFHSILTFYWNSNRVFHALRVTTRVAPYGNIFENYAPPSIRLFFLPVERVCAMRGSISFARGSVSFARGIVFFARGSISFARGSVSFARGSIFFARGSVFFARGSVFFARESVFFARRSVFFARESLQRHSNFKKTP